MKLQARLSDAHGAEESKVCKCAMVAQVYCFVPVAIETTLGVFNPRPYRL